MDLIDVDPNSSNAIGGNVWNDRNARFRRIAATYGGAGISVFNTDSSVTISNTRAKETGTALVTALVPGCVGGFYRCESIPDPANPSDETIDIDDFGQPVAAFDTIFMNAAELIGAPPLQVNSTCIVIGRYSGYNVDDDAVGTDDDYGLQVLEGLAYTSPMFPVLLSSPSGSASTGYSYTVKDLSGNQLGTSITPSFRWFAPASINIATAATTGTGYFDTTNTFVLKYADEIPKLTAC